MPGKHLCVSLGNASGSNFTATPTSSRPPGPPSQGTAAATAPTCPCALQRTGWRYRGAGTDSRDQSPLPTSFLIFCFLIQLRFPSRNRVSATRWGHRWSRTQTCPRGRRGLCPLLRAVNSASRAANPPGAPAAAGGPAPGTPAPALRRSARGHRPPPPQHRGEQAQSGLGPGEEPQGRSLPGQAPGQARLPPRSPLPPAGRPSAALTVAVGLLAAAVLAGVGDGGPDGLGHGAGWARLGGAARLAAPGPAQGRRGRTAPHRNYRAARAGAPRTRGTSGSGALRQWEEPGP